MARSGAAPTAGARVQNAGYRALGTPVGRLLGLPRSRSRPVGSAAELGRERTEQGGDTLGAVDADILDMLNASLFVPFFFER